MIKLSIENIVHEVDITVHAKKRTNIDELFEGVKNLYVTLMKEPVMTDRKAFVPKNLAAMEKFMIDEIDMVPMIEEDEQREELWVDHPEEAHDDDDEHDYAPNMAAIEERF